MNALKCAPRLYAARQAASTARHCERGSLPSSWPAALCGAPRLRAFKVVPPMRAPKGKVGSKVKQAQAAAASSAPAEEAEAPKGKDLKAQLESHLDFMRRELTKIRGSTTNPNMLDNVIVEVYGERQQLKEIAQVALRNPLQLLVSPFDVAMVDAIADGIRDADRGLNPSVDGNSVKVPVPKTSQETRAANVKLIGKVAEQAKTRIRRSRGDALETTKKQDGISEDDVRRDNKLVEEQVAAATAEVAKLAEKKKQEVEAA